MQQPLAQVDGVQASVTLDNEDGREGIRWS